VHGAKVDSKYLELTPGPIVGGDLAIDIGTSGSTTLVVQTILIPAITAGHAVRATIRGGTHNPMAPPFDFLDRVFLPHLRAMGADVTLTLDEHGFVGGRKAHERGPRSNPEGIAEVDRGGALGQLTLEVRGGALRPIEITEGGAAESIHAAAIVSRLPTHVADRELAVVRARFPQASCEVREVRAGSTGNVLTIEIVRAHGRELITGFGEKGIRAETVAERACDEAAAFLAADVPVGEHLADQLVLPLALAGGGRFRCAPLSLHATTNIETIGLFLDVPIRVEPDGAAVIVTVG
jgi:RNA 3'-terminal phosphate cyclase (ATP)